MPQWKVSAGHEWIIPYFLLLLLFFWTFLIFVHGYNKTISLSLYVSPTGSYFSPLSPLSLPFSNPLPFRISHLSRTPPPLLPYTSPLKALFHVACGLGF